MLRNSLFSFYVWVSNKECAYTFLMCTFQCKSPLQYLSFSLSLSFSLALSLYFFIDWVSNKECAYSFCLSVSLSLYFFIDVVLLHSLVHIPGDVASFRKIFSCCPSSVVIRHTPLGIANNCSWFRAYFQCSKVCFWISSFWILGI